MTITDGYAPEPEQSTLALIAHHPQAIYFGTRQGRLLPERLARRRDQGLLPRSLAVRRRRGDHRCARRRRPARRRRRGRGPGRAGAGGRRRLLSGSRRCGDQRQLFIPIEPLDPRFLPARGAAVGHRQRQRQLDRQSTGGVTAALARLMTRQTTLHVGRPARVERAVAATQHVNPGVRHLLRMRLARAAGGRQRAELHRRRVHRAQPDIAPGQPFLQQRRHPHQHGRRDLDGLQDDSVGERVG